MHTRTRSLILALLCLTIATSFVRPGFTADEPPIPFLSEVAGKYTGTVKIINWGPDTGGTDNDFWGIVTALREAKGQSFPAAFEVIAETRFKGKLVWRGAGDEDKQDDLAIPFTYEPIGGRILLDAVIPKLPDIHAKVDCAATMVPRGDRYTVQLAGSLHLISATGDKDGWINIGVKATSKDVLERVNPPKPAPIPAYKPSETKRRDSGSRFSDLSGQVEVFHFDYQKQDWAANGDVCKIDTILYVDDKIVTGEDSEAVISFSDMTTFHMRAESAIILDPPPERTSKITLLMGNILVNIKKMIKDGTMEVHMSQAVAGIKGTLLVCRETGNSSEISVLEGVVEIRHRATGKVQSIKAGQTLVATTEGFNPVKEFDAAKERATWPQSSTSKSPAPPPATAESPAAEVPRPAPRPLNGRPYVHPSGEFQFTATQGWGHIANFRNKVPDPDAETLLDDSQQIAVSLMKHVNPISNARTAFARWLGMVSRSLDQPGMQHGLRIDKFAYGNGAGWRVSYRITLPLVVSRIFLTHNGRWYILNVIAPLEYGQAELPRPVVELFNSLEFLTPEEPAARPPLGVQRLKLTTLDQLSNDFGLIAYEHGVVIQDKVQGVEQLIRAEAGPYNMQDNTANLLKGDTVLLKALGPARSAPIGVFDYRFEVQFYDGGVAIHDPVSSVVWVKTFN